jgi:hypothetical protein
VKIVCDCTAVGTHVRRLFLAPFHEGLGEFDEREQHPQWSFGERIVL